MPGLCLFALLRLAPPEAPCQIIQEQLGYGGSIAGLKWPQLNLSPNPPCVLFLSRSDLSLCAKALKVFEILVRCYVFECQNH